MELADSILISLTSAVTPSNPDLGAGTGEAAESEGEEPPVTLGTKTAAATLRALSAPLRGLEGALVAPLALLGELAGEAADVAESAEENCAAGDLGAVAEACEVEGVA